MILSGRRQGIVDRGRAYANAYVKITINWPEDLLNDEIIPRTVFGSDLQAVNDIRKQEKVFIILQPNHSVEILGLNMLNIEAAELRYRSLLHRMRIEKCNLYQATNILLDEREGIDVTLLRAESWWPDHTDMVVPRLLPSSMMEQPGSFRDDVLSDQRLEQIRIAIQRSLEAVRHRKGYYDFAVHFGSVALDAEKMGQNYVGRTFGKEKFLKSINGTVDLRPKKWYVCPLSLTASAKGPGCSIMSWASSSITASLQQMTSWSLSKLEVLGVLCLLILRTLIHLCEEPGYFAILVTTGNHIYQLLATEQGQCLYTKRFQLQRLARRLV